MPESVGVPVPGPVTRRVGTRRRGATALLPGAMGAGGDGGQALSRVVIQLERLPFAALDARSVQTEFALADTIGRQEQFWHVTGDWTPTGRDPNAAGPLPGPLANDILVALGRKWNALPDLEGRDMKHIDSRTLKIGMRELMALMGHEPSGHSYETLRETVARMKRVAVTTRGMWKEDGEWVAGELSFNLFDESLVVQRQDGTAEGSYIVFTLSYRVAEALMEHSRLLDTTTYRRIGTDVARRLYRVLEAERHVVDHRGERTLRIPLLWLRERLPLPATKTAHIKRALDRAHGELQRTTDDGPAYLGPVTYVPTPAEDLRRYALPRDRDVRQKLVSACYTILREPTPARRPDPTTLAEAVGPQLAALGIALPTSPAESELARRVRRVERVTGDRTSSGTFKRLCELLTEEDFEFVTRGVEVDARGSGFDASTLGKVWVRRAQDRVRPPALARAGHPRG